MNSSLYEDWIRPLGDEYPAAIKVGDTRIALANETRFKRHYLESKPDAVSHIDISRFLDGTASITLPQLKEEWSTWQDADRSDLCRSMLDLVNAGQQDLPEIARFLLQNAEVDMLGPLVLQLPGLQTFPPDETFELLMGVLQRSTLGHTADVIRALSLTQHSEAEATIRRHLGRIVADPTTWVNAKFFNKMARDAAYCVLSLVKLGAPPADFDGIVRRLSEHPCTRNREWCRRNFARHYPWLRG